MNKAVAVIGFGLVSAVSIYAYKKYFKKAEVVTEIPPVQPKKTPVPEIRELKPEEIVHEEKTDTGTIFYTIKNGKRIVQRFEIDSEQDNA